MAEELLVAITVRMNSERFPGKVLHEIDDKPLLYWIIERFKQVKPQPKIVIAATTDRMDDVLALFGARHNIPVHRGKVGDVVGQMEEIRQKYAPKAQFIMRGLGDCPFIEPTLVSRAVDVLKRTKGEAFSWYVHHDTAAQLVYGTREFPYSLSGWQKIVANSKENEREHVDLHFHKNRENFNIIYHEAPSRTYFRPYRLEIDWEEDVRLVEKIAENVSLVMPLTTIIRYLDENNDIANINRELVEKTGLDASYDYDERRRWAKLMQGKPFITWNDEVYHPQDDRSTPIYCSSGKCIMGYGHKGILYRLNGDRIRGGAYMQCDCGAGLTWKEPIRRGHG